MFNKIIQEYSDRRIELKERIAESKGKLSISSVSLNSNITKSLNSQVEILHDNQRKIELQCKTLKQESEKLITQSQNWAKLYGALNSSFKQLGDINNWASVIEKEMGEVTMAITNLVSK